MTNLRTVKKDLAAAYPEIDFTYGIAGRGHNKGHSISWKGGPDELTVRLASHCGHANCWRHVWHFSRTMSDAEQVEYDAKQNADPDVWGSDAWIADTAAREAREFAKRAANRKAGAAQAAETRARNKMRSAKLADSFPGIEFTLKEYGVTWTDGPEAEAVADVVFEFGWSRWNCTRLESWDVRQNRLARENAEREAWDAGANAREAEEEAKHEAECQAKLAADRAIEIEEARLELLAEHGTETVLDDRQLLMFADAAD